MQSGWEQLFSGSHGGRPYYHHKETKATQWAEPASFRAEQERIDMDVFGLSREDVRAVMASLRALQSHETTWGAARDVLGVILGNIVNAPYAAKYRTVMKKSTRFLDHVYNVSGGQACMRAVGFVDTPDGEAVVLPTHAQIEPCRLALAHIERSRVLVHDNSGNNNNGGERGGGRFEQFTCSACVGICETGAERLWTGKWDAPKGEYRYECDVCVAPRYILCERCWDVRCGGGGDHASSHAFTAVPPITTRHNTTVTGDGPWGVFSGTRTTRHARAVFVCHVTRARLEQKQCQCVIDVRLGTPFHPIHVSCPRFRRCGIWSFARSTARTERLVVTRVTSFATVCLERCLQKSEIWQGCSCFVDP